MKFKGKEDFSREENISLREVRGRSVRLTAERLFHIEENHPEILNAAELAEEVLAAPEEIVRSRSDPEIELYYRFYRDTQVGEKYSCIVVKFTEDDAFILTVYLTDKVKQGKRLWPTT